MSAEIAVVGGRGKTGRAVISALNSLGAAVRPIGRSELQAPLEALSGCSAAYLMAPNMHPAESEFVDGVLTAARDAGVSRIVYHSVAAPYAPEMPHHLAKAESERVIRKSGLEWSILQPCAYIQNFVPQLLGSTPTIVVPYDADRKFGLIDVLDVGEIAARVLLKADFIGSTVEIGGPARVSIRDVVTSASAVLERDVRLRVVSPGEWAQGPGAGLESRERNWLVAMFEYYDAYGLPAGSAGAKHILGRAPNALDEVLRRELLG